jgi:prevent-host-death family protein
MRNRTDGRIELLIVRISAHMISRVHLPDSRIPQREVTATMTTETMKMTDAKQQFSRVVNDVYKTHRRVLVEKGGIPIAAIVTAGDLERLNQLDADWEAGFEVLDEIGSAFSQLDPEEIEREVAAAITEVRSEQRTTAS